MVSENCTAEAFLCTIVYVFVLFFLFLLQLLSFHACVCLDNTPIFVRI